MKRTVIVSFGLVLALGAYGCSDDDTTGTDGGVADAGGGGDAGVENPPAAPTLGAQIDRMGRPAINTALTAPISAAAAADTAKDAYNVSAEASWSTTYGPIFAASLAIYDSLDTTCGNQLLAGATVDATRYTTLGGALAVDKLYLNTGTGTCEAYLGVEAGVATDCGGRAPRYDVVDVTYSVLAIGAVTGVDDGVANDNTFLTTFPFLAAPNSAP